jgi:hypothetical protein
VVFFQPATIAETPNVVLEPEVEAETCAGATKQFTFLHASINEFLEPTFNFLSSSQALFRGLQFVPLFLISGFLTWLLIHIIYALSHPELAVVFIFDSISVFPQHMCFAFEYPFVCLKGG